MKKILLCLVVMFILCGCSTESLSAKAVTCSDKNSIVKENKDALLIDVRTEEEYKEGHIDKAINIEYDKIVETLATYGTVDFDTPIVVYCKSGGRSGMAASSLIDAGYKNVYDLGAMSNCD